LGRAQVSGACFKRKKETLSRTLKGPKGKKKMPRIHYLKKPAPERKMAGDNFPKAKSGPPYTGGGKDQKRRDDTALSRAG